MTHDTTHVCTKGKIWELHIHSNQCSSASAELKALTIPDYVTALLNILGKYDDLEMISFTDHNAICFELYHEFISRQSKYVLLPGIEIDASLVLNGTNKNSKHIIVYFDAIDDINKLDSLSSSINTFLNENNVGVKKGRKPIYIYHLLDKLVSLKIPFILSPHAMKQGKRDIDADWHSMEASKRTGEMKKYLDQFFCFWESSGTSQIHHAEEFLKEMDCGERIPIVAFSDSKDFDKLQKYLEHPCQYFNALPNFNGLKMAGSEISRISREQYLIADSDRGRYIGKVQFGNQIIELTPRLNAIIGGRGSGKSILLDSIANSLGLPANKLEKERLQFIRTFNVSIKSMGGGTIDYGQFHFDYYDQSYIAKLFQKHGEDFNAELESYFQTAFEHVGRIPVEHIQNDYEEAFRTRLTIEEPHTPQNLEGFIEKYIIDNKDKLSIAIRDKDRKKIDKKLDKFEYSSTIESIDSALNKRLPHFLREDDTVQEAILHLEQIICSRAYKKRLNYIRGDYLFNTICTLFKQKKSSISKAQSDRASAIALFQATFENKALCYRKRVALVNAFIGSCDDFQTHYEETYQAHGERKCAFLFKRELNIEHPLDYMVRIIGDHMTVRRGIGQCSRTNLLSCIFEFCFNDDCYKQGCSADTLYDNLKQYDLKYIEQSAIYYLQDDGTYVDVSKLSPGTQTNILIEYIVHQDTDNPLLIDQPEDNVDNQTIYRKIRQWFMTLKTSRQVIVVTHDANIVINADADNIILAEQMVDGTFKYDWGALEYEDILERASLILDGGKEAVKRRLVKYGE